MSQLTEGDDIEHSTVTLTDEEWVAYAEACGFDPAIGAPPSEGDDE